jgi:tRNA A-37 threonylcarbamoyl transferase component Bud32
MKIMGDTTTPPVTKAAAPPLLPREDRAAWKPGPGTMAGEYVLQSVVGLGGHGAVYRAEHRILGRRAAVKVLHSHLSDKNEMLQRFVREAQVINKIRHPNIVDIHDFGLLQDGSPYYVMELLPARTLTHLLLERGRLSPARVLEFLEPVCDALAAAHRIGVVHRDLKTSNVAVVSDGDPPQVKLLDFGIAKIIHPEPDQPSLTTDGQRLGSPNTMAPEQIRGGPIGPATDIYALGVMLYRMLTGEYPFQSQDRTEVERMHLEVPPPRPSSRAPVSAAVDAVVLRCLEKDAQRRYPTVMALLAALREAVAPPVSAQPGAGSRSARAFVLHAEGVIVAGEEDDAAYTAAATVLDALEQDLRDLGFILAEQMGLTLLGVWLLDETSHLKPQALLALARELHQRTQARAAGSNVSVHLCVHVGQVETRQGPDGPEITGGPLADTAGWVVRDASGLAVTPEASRTSLP